MEDTVIDAVIVTQGSSKVFSRSSNSCLICHKRLNAPKKSADKNSVTETLNKIASVFEISSSIYREVDLNDIPFPLLCPSCVQTVHDASKVQNANKTLQKQTANLIEIIKRDIIQSYRLDSQTSNNATSDDCGQVKLIRKTYAQCWGTCEVRLIACDIPRKILSPSCHIDDKRSSPFSGFVDEDFDEIDGMRGHSEDETCWNPDAIKIEFPEGDNITNLEGQFIAESITFKEIETNLQSTESDSLAKTVPGSNNTDTLGSTKHPTTEISSTFTANIPGSSKIVRNVTCNPCGKVITRSSSLKHHLRKDKYPCVNRRLVAATASSSLEERMDLASKRIASSPKIKNRKALPCYMCDQVFTFKSRLKSHIAIKHGQRSECPLCGEYINEEKLQHHIELHNGSKDFPCKQCNARLRTYRLCISHIRTYHSNPKCSKKLLKCKSCPREFSTCPELLEHKKVHLKGKMLGPSATCTLYSVNYQTKEKIQKRMRSHVNGMKFFKCDFCNQIFLELSLAKEHVNIEHAQEIQAALKCTICEKTLPTKETLNEHLNMHRGEEELSKIRHQCGICKQICSSFANLCAHKKSEHGMSKNFASRLKAYKCTFCSKAFTAKSQLTFHTMRHGGKENFNCTLCEAVFMTSRKLGFHLRLHEKGLPIPVERCFKFKCNICDQRFEWKEMYELHMKKHENPIETISKSIQAKVHDQKNVMSFDCQVCKQTFCKESHTSTKTQQFEIVCQHGNCNCKATFTTLKTFMYHHKKVCQIRYGRANFDMRVTCDECGKVLINPTRLKEHKHRIHPGPGSLICKFCGKAFGLPYMLENHMVIHSSEKNFQCHVCGSKYTGKKLLSAHIIRCHSDVQIPCDVCGKQFKTMAYMRKHKNCVHSQSESQIPCHICGKLFKARENVTKHIYTTHDRRRKPKDRKTAN